MAGSGASDDGALDGSGTGEGELDEVAGAALAAGSLATLEAPPTRAAGGAEAVVVATFEGLDIFT
jgi:hypothetical protein